MRAKYGKLLRIFFKNEVYPSLLKIFIWDKLFTPLTILLDKILKYKYSSDNINFLGKVDHSKLPEVLKKYDVHFNSAKKNNVPYKIRVKMSLLLSLL